ncbi:major facilitator superfamily protein [Rhodotorula toruloides]|nr:major facilitator superfamily protein [Rhodotorula toruloides]
MQHPAGPATPAGLTSPASTSRDPAATPPPAFAQEAAMLGEEGAALPGEGQAAGSRTPTVAGVEDLDPKAEGTSTLANEGEVPPTLRQRGGTTDFGFLPIPPRLRFDPDKPFEFGLLLNVVFAFAATFSVANLYYPQPILIVLSDKFNCSYDRVTNIPTLLQASYALGLAFICPLGDLFFLGAASVTPQILLPLSGDLARPERRASALSIVLSGLLLGILLARVLSGLIAEKASVLALYYMSFGVQIAIWFLVYEMIPDYPAKNPDLHYFEILWSMVKYLFTEPVLVQGCLICGVGSIIFSAFWTTSTFILGDLYHYNSLEIGLFALIGIAGVCAAPLLGRLVDNLVPWVGVLLGIVILAISQAIFTGAAGVSIGALCVVIFTLDIGMQLQQVANSTRIFGISSAARARLSAVFLVCIFAGQLIGTAAGTRVYLDYGYRASGGLCVGLTGFMLLVLFLRGPHCPVKQWFGWTGGWELRKAVHERKQAERRTSGIEMDEKAV